MSAPIANAHRLFTDGACKGNPGPMGLGIVVLDAAGEPLWQHGEPAGHGTNQVAEILAAARGLEALAAGSTVELHTDSQYVVMTMTQGWKRKVNLDAWTRLDRAVARHSRVSFHHVRGHNGNEWNEAADRLASSAAAGKTVEAPHDRIVAAAIQRDGLCYALPAPARHADILRAIHVVTGEAPVQGIEGFMTSRGQFLDRKAAARLCLANGQLPAVMSPPELYSEDLW